MPPLSADSPAIVIDAGIGVSSALQVAESDLASQAWSRWRSAGAEIFAPELWLYEVISSIRKAVASGDIQADEAEGGLAAALAFQPTLVPADVELCRSALQFADRLGQTAAYDGFYLAVASRLQADFWTTDQRLVDAARQVGVRWTHWIGELEPNQI